jgi:hypothetical protein
MQNEVSYYDDTVYELVLENTGTGRAKSPAITL